MYATSEFEKIGGVRVPEMSAEFIQNLATKNDMIAINQSLKDIHEELKRILDKHENRIDGQESKLHDLKSIVDNHTSMLEVRPGSRCIDAMRGIAQNVVTEAVDSNNLRLKAAHEEWHELEKEKRKGKWQYWNVVFSVLKGVFWLIMTVLAFVKFLLPSLGV